MAFWQREQSDPAPRNVALVAFPAGQSLDVSGPFEVFAAAGEWLARTGAATAGYAPELLALRAGPLRMSSGLELGPARALTDASEPIDTLIVAGGPGTAEALRERALVDWIAAAAGRARRVCSVCTGTFLLAEAGLLEGRRVTTHWNACEALARRYPGLTVDPDPIFVRDGSVWTSAGVTAGMDLALALVEEDHGRDCALAVARRLVLFLQRPGGQSQFSAELAHQMAEREPLRELQSWMLEHLEEDLSVPVLARRSGMSPRNFARVFTREVGMTPARYVEALRVEAARRRLEESRSGVGSVAEACGFGSEESMRRAFLRSLRVSPSDYRARF